MPKCRKELIEALGASEQADCFDNKTVAKEKKKEFRIENKSHKTICRVQVDGCLIDDRSTKRCDFLFKICETERYVLVELKGSNVEDAFPQLINTHRYLREKLNITTEQCEAVIVSTRVPSAANRKVQQLKKQCLDKHKLPVRIDNRRASYPV